MPTNPWIVLGLLAFSVATTVVTSWLVARTQPAVPWPPRSPAAIAAGLLWMLLLFVAGLIAVRYIERIPNAAVGYLIFGLGALALSLVRASLYQRSQDQQRAEERTDAREFARVGLHTLTYLLFALVLDLTLSLLLRRPADPLLFIPLGIGALLPDLDSQTSVMGRLLPFIARRLETRLGHLQAWHTLAAAAFVALITLPLLLFVDVWAWALIPLGFLSHLALDLLNPQGIILLWPIKHTRYSVFRGPVDSPGNAFERRLAVALALVAGILLLAVDLGPAPSPPVPVPTYEQTVERYYAMRGRYLVFADVQGTWQATGRRVSGRYEVLNAAGQSFTMLDRYTGKVFTAGRAPTDNLYLNGIRLTTGSPVRIKAIEVQLRDQPLAQALPLVYSMQREPGLQHIYVSGDVIVPTLQDIVSPTLAVDYAQTSLRRIQAQDGGHYSLHYLTASDLIELANVGVETADLVIVATYERPATGPTVTPLPSPPPLVPLPTRTGE